MAERNILRKFRRKVLITSCNAALLQHIQHTMKTADYQDIEVECCQDVENLKDPIVRVTELQHKLRDCHHAFIVIARGLLYFRLQHKLQDCHHVFIVTVLFKDKSSVTYSTRMALEYVQKTGQLNATLVFLKPHSSGQDLEQMLSSACFKHIGVIHADTNRRYWESHLLKNMRKRILCKILQLNVVADRKVNEHLVIKELPTGLAWIHFVGFLTLVLPVLESSICTSKIYMDNQTRFPLKMFVILPTDADVVRRLETLHEGIRHEYDIVCTTQGERLGIPVYSLTDNKTNETYYFVGHMPNILNVLNVLEKIQEGNSKCYHDALLVNFTERDKNFAIARFYFMLNMLSNSPLMQGCKDKVRFIFVGNGRENIRASLLNTIQQELDYERDSTNVGYCYFQHDTVPHSADQVSDKLSQILYKTKVDARETVCLSFCGDVDGDQTTALELCTIVESLNRRVLGFVEHFPNDLEEEVKTLSHQDSIWFLFILSKAAFRETGFRDFTRHWLNLLYNVVFNHNVRVIMVLDGIDEEFVSSDFNALVCISKQDPDYLDQIMNIIKCGPIVVEKQLSGQHVHQVLAFAYVMNYLENVMTELLVEMAEIAEEFMMSPVHKKLFALVPGSCNGHVQGALNVDKHGKLLDHRFMKIRDICLPVSRKTFIFYKLIMDYKERIVVVEVPRAVRSLRRMCELSPLSGLTTDNVFEEAYKFKDYAQKIIDSRPELVNKAKLLYYDDTRLSLVDALIEVLEDEVLDEPILKCLTVPTFSSI